MKSQLVGLLLIGSIASLIAQDATTFCPAGPPGTYCAENGVGFYWCVPNGGNWYIGCPSGTVCNCFQGPDCSTVPTVGDGSPCGYASVLPSFPESYTASTSTVSELHAPVGIIATTSTSNIYMDRSNNRERIDTASSTSDYGQPPTSSNIVDYYFDNNNGTVSHYSYNSDSQSCMLTLDSGVLPNSRVPAGYQFLREDTWEGVAVNVYYFRNGGRIPSYETGLHDYLYVTQSSPAEPVHESIYDNVWRQSVSANVTWNSFTVGSPSASLFSLPTACN